MTEMDAVDECIPFVLESPSRYSKPMVERPLDKEMPDEMSGIDDVLAPALGLFERVCGEEVGEGTMI